MTELSKFYYYVGKKLADFKSSISHEKITDENAKKQPKNSDKNKSKKSKTREVTDERSEDH